MNDNSNVDIADTSNC